MKRAVLIGINKYKMPGANLNGCINDVVNMRDILKTYYGFSNNDIRVVTDERATKNEILARVKWLVTSVRPGDTLVLHYSGHGSQIRDRHNDELGDGLDELICPHDMDWNGIYILDDDFDNMFKNMPTGVKLEVFFDCCHSGTGLKEFDFGRPVELAPENMQNKERYLPPPIDVLMRQEGEEASLTKKSIMRVLPNVVKTSMPTLWAGCKSTQTSADAYIQKSYNGAFTYYFCSLIRAAKGKVTRGELIDKLQQTVKMNGYEQTPQLECDSSVKSQMLLGA